MNTAQQAALPSGAPQLAHGFTAGARWGWGTQQAERAAAALHSSVVATGWAWRVAAHHPCVRASLWGPRAVGGVLVAGVCA